MTTQASYAAGPSRIDGDVMNQSSAQGIIDMEAQLGMINPLYYYDDFEPTYEEANRYVDNTVEEDKLAKLISQFMWLIPKCEDVSGLGQIICNGWILSRIEF